MAWRLCGARSNCPSPVASLAMALAVCVLAVVGSGGGCVEGDTCVLRDLFVRARNQSAVGALGTCVRVSLIDSVVCVCVWVFWGVAFLLLLLSLLE